MLVVSVDIYTYPPVLPVPLQIPAESVLTGTQMHSKYKIMRKLATTNTGTVFSGQDRATVEPVAIKVHHKRGSSALCVYNEAALHASLDHPNIVKLLAFADLKDDVFMVQEVCLCACFFVCLFLALVCICVRRSGSVGRRHVSYLLIPATKRLTQTPLLRHAVPGRWRVV